MKDMILMTFNSIKNKINFEERKYCFEIFGFDFILDVNLQLWLIEVNTNPCIEESSSILQTYLPRMIDDAFKLTLDVLFPKPKNMHSNLKQSGSTNSVLQSTPTFKVSLELQQPKPNDQDQKTLSTLQLDLPQIIELEDVQEWPVKGYPDDTNMWYPSNYSIPRTLLAQLNDRKKAQPPIIRRRQQ